MCVCVCVYIFLFPFLPYLSLYLSFPLFLFTLLLFVYWLLILHVFFHCFSLISFAILFLCVLFFFTFSISLLLFLLMHSFLCFSFHFSNVIRFNFILPIAKYFKLYTPFVIFYFLHICIALFLLYSFPFFFKFLFPGFLCIIGSRPYAPLSHLSFSNSYLCNVFCTGHISELSSFLEI